MQQSIFKYIFLIFALQFTINTFAQKNIHQRELPFSGLKGRVDSVVVETIICDTCDYQSVNESVRIVDHFEDNGCIRKKTIENKMNFSSTLYKRDENALITNIYTRKNGRQVNTVINRKGNTDYYHIIDPIGRISKTNKAIRFFDNKIVIYKPNKSEILRKEIVHKFNAQGLVDHIKYYDLKTKAFLLIECNKYDEKMHLESTIWSKTYPKLNVLRKKIYKHELDTKGNIIKTHIYENGELTQINSYTIYYSKD